MSPLLSGVGFGRVGGDPPANLADLGNNVLTISFFCICICILRGGPANLADLGNNILTISHLFSDFEMHFDIFHLRVDSVDNVEYDVIYQICRAKNLASVVFYENRVEIY